MVGGRVADPKMSLARPILKSFAAVGGGEGKIAVTAVARRLTADARSVADNLAASLGHEPLPDWITQGRRRVDRTSVLRAFAQVRTVGRGPRR